MNIEKDKLPKGEAEGVEKVLDYAWSAYQLRVDDFGVLDSKAATLSGFVSIVLTLSTALLVYQEAAIATAQTLTLGECLIRCIFSGAILLLAAAFFFCLMALRCRINETPPAISDIIKTYIESIDSGSAELDVMIYIVKSIAAAEAHRIKTNGKKSKNMKWATGFLFAAFALAVLGLLGQFAGIWKKTWEMFK